MSKLPNIFHSNGKFITNNKNTFNTFDKKVESKSIDYNLINYFNKRITLELKTGKSIVGVLLSKRDNMILLDTGDYINIKDIISIK